MGFELRLHGPFDGNTKLIEYFLWIYHKLVISHYKGNMSYISNESGKYGSCRGTEMCPRE